MAFSKTPTQDTYDTKRFPIVGMPQQRNGFDELKDQRFLNCFTEAIKAQVTDAKKYYVKKRNGLALRVTQAGTTRGCIYEDVTRRLYFVVGTTIYSYDGTNIVTIQTGIAAGGNVGMTIHLSTQVQVIVLTGTQGWVIDPFAQTAAQITDPDFPSPHVIYPVSMDGYLFVVKENRPDIYNSNLDDPFTWDASQFITAEMYPDNIVALTKNNNYVIAVGTGSMEYFYDIGNATGSPLQRNDSAVQQMGTTAPDSVVQTEKEVIMVASTANGGRTVWVVEGFKAEEIGTEAVRMNLNLIGQDIGTINAYCTRIDGHKFYVLRIPTQLQTWVYDFDTKLWTEWNSTVAGVDATFIGKFAADSPFGYPFMMGANGEIFLMSEQTYQDNGQLIKTQITTLKLDFDNMNRKDMSRLSLFGDWPLSGSSTLSVEWSDDDYRTWSSPRTIQLSTYLPVTRRLGKFRRRAFRLTHTDNTPLRLEGMEVDINNGSS